MHPTGDLEGATADALRDAVDAVLAARGEGLTTVVVDLARVRSVAAAGLTALLRAQRACHDAGLDLRLICADAPVRRVLAGTELGRRLPLYPDLDHAVGTASAETLLDELRLKVRDHERARASLPVIEQAKGMLMGRFGLDAEEAFTVLRTLSQEHNTKLRDLADRLTAAAPDGTDRDGARARAVDATREWLQISAR
ncbi:ANTAR domain-containing protein [Actinomycetospora sp. CA-101289]|uniref:ANTAR domain-containing protein n=1 Tax=Actinomycetospora sp. CA-101289 TaxID=3239893 RepID=UPI003D99E1CD